MILVTGGAGFIGSNFVLDWLARRRAGRQPRQAHLRRQPAQPRRARRRRAPRFVRGDICDRAARRAALAEAPAARDGALRGREPRGPLDPRARRDFIQTNVVGTFTLLEAARAYWQTLGGSAKDAFRFLHVSTDEVYGSLGADDPAFTETTPYAPNSPYSASKAASDHLVRAYHHTYGLPVLTTNCSNNYGPYQFPEKLIPLMILNALAGKPLPVYGDGSERARLAVRRRPLRSDPPRARARPARRDLQHRRRRRAEEYRRRARRSAHRSTSCGRAPPAGYQRADHVRHRSAGPRPALRDRRVEDRGRARLAPRESLRDWLAQDGALVPGERGLGRARSRAAPIAAGSRRTTAGAADR